MREMEEERARMREHVMQEVDLDGDGAISLEEFIKYTQSQEFQKPTNEYQWIDEMIASGDVYSEEDLRKYRLQVQEHEETLKAKLKTLKGEALELAKHKQDFQVAKGIISISRGDATILTFDVASLASWWGELCDIERVKFRIKTDNLSFLIGLKISLIPSYQDFPIFLFFYYSLQYSIDIT